MSSYRQKKNKKKGQAFQVSKPRRGKKKERLGRGRRGGFERKIRRKKERAASVNYFLIAGIRERGGI